MLTEPQFKVLMILFDDKGHAGWELAKDLGVKESNLNPYLKILEERKFIFQGPPRRSTKPKKRDGDYKEIPFYLTRDPEFLGTIIDEMVVTNRVYDTGFPLRIIKTCNYFKYFKNVDEFNINEFLMKLSRNLNIIELRYLMIEPELKHFVNNDPIKILHLTSSSGESSRIAKRKVTKRSLKELELWWHLYNLCNYCSQDLINVDKLEKMIYDDILDDCILGDDILEIIYNAVEKLPDHENLSIWGRLNDMRTLLDEMPKDIEKKEYFYKNIKFFKFYIILNIAQRWDKNRGKIVEH